MKPEIIREFPVFLSFALRKSCRQKQKRTDQQNAEVIMIKLEGFDKLSRNLEEAQRALELLDGDLGTISFNPMDPSSIEAAIQEVERLVDERAEPYASNPFVGSLIGEIKEKYRIAIIEKATAARLAGGNE